MTTKPKLLAKTPDNADVNSLIMDHEQIITEQRDRQFAIVEFGVVDVTYPVDGDALARLSIRHFEQVRGAELDAALAVMDTAFKKRTKLNQRPGPDAPDTPLDLSGLDPAAAQAAAAADAAFEAAAPTAQ